MSLLSLRRPLGRRVKRVLDVVLAGVGGILLLPLFLVVAVVVRAEGPGPVFFRQERVGQGGRPFRIWKFRSMVHGAEALGPSVTAAHDGRVTRVGRWLRRTKLDELPQLMNVLVGTMSMVGPRPELPRYVALYDAQEREVLAHRPGITDPATLAYRNEEEMLAGVPDPQRHYEDVILRHKVALNLAYANDATVLTDMGVLLKTVRALLVG